MLLRYKKNRLALKWQFLAVFVFITLLFLSVAYLILCSNLFKVNDFRMEDPGFYDKDFVVSNLTVQAIVNKQFLGFIGGDNVIFWILGKNNLINEGTALFKDVKVSVSLLNGEVNILFKKRSLFGVICRRSDCFAFDEEGIVFSGAPKVEGPLILKILDTNDGTPLLGKPFLSRNGWVNNIFETLNIIKDNGFHVASVTIRQADLREWEITLPAGTKFYFDLDFIPEDLSDILNNLRKKVDPNDLRYLDFRVKGRIYYK